MKNDVETNKTIFNLEKAKYLNIQLIAIIGFIIALIMSFLITYNKKLTLENKQGIFSDEITQNLAIFQSILVFIITICFLYTNYNQYKISKKAHDNDEQDLLLQIETSIFAIISAIIGLYIIFKNYRNANIAISETELF